MKTNPVHDFILESEKNLRIAAAVGAAWPEAREKLVAGFFGKLCSELTKKLPGWKSEPSGIFFNDSYPTFALWKPVWENQYWVTLQCDNYGEKMVFGVSRNIEEEIIKKRPHSDELLAAIGKLYPSARARNWWEAWTTMQSPAPDWRKPEVLWRMHTDEKFLDDVADQFVQLAEVCEPIVDRLVREK